MRREQLRLVWFLAPAALLMWFGLPMARWIAAAVGVPHLPLLAAFCLPLAALPWYGAWRWHRTKSAVRAAKFRLCPNCLYPTRTGQTECPECGYRCTEEQAIREWIESGA